jgi:serine/threonine protein phosphatase 1
VAKYAISDIHGCTATFVALLERIGLTHADELYLLGDYIDRGPNSKGVLDRIARLIEEGYQVSCLMGNHEQMMIWAGAFEELAGLGSSWKADRYNPGFHNMWLRNGGGETLASFGVHSAKEVPRSYFQFLRKLGYYLEVEGYLLVHAGFDFHAPDPWEDRESMLWIRDWYEWLDRDLLGDRVIVHGHTPIGRKAIEYMLGDLRNFPVLNIDAGCVYANSWNSDVGWLCAFDLDRLRVIFQKNIG